jgi:hypothetical protein
MQNIKLAKIDTDKMEKHQQLKTIQPTPMNTTSVVAVNNTSNVTKIEEPKKTDSKKPEMTKVM